MLDSSRPDGVRARATQPVPPAVHRPVPSPPSDAGFVARVAVPQRSGSTAADGFQPAAPVATSASVDSAKLFQLNQAQSALLRMARDFAPRQGVSGLLDLEKIAWFRKVYPAQHKLRGVDPATFKLIAHYLPALEQRAQRNAGGGLRLHASALRPVAIPHERIRASATAVAETISMGRRAPDPASLNILEVREALRLLASSDPQDKALRALMLDRFGRLSLVDMAQDGGRAAVKALASDLRIVEQYLRTGTNGLLTSGYTQLVVGERGKGMKREAKLRQLEIFEMPDAQGQMGGIASKEDAAKLAHEYLPRAIKTGMDPVFIYEPSEKKLFVALNPHGDLDALSPERNVQLFDQQGAMIGTGIVVAWHDTINSPGEVFPGWYAKAAVKVGDMAEAMVKPDAQAEKFVGKVEMGTLAAERPWWRLLTAAGLVGAITTLVSQIPILVVGLFGGAAVPGVINTIRYMSQDQRLTPIEDLMGVTVVGTSRDS